jgi:hypothetical protein
MSDKTGLQKKYTLTVPAGSEVLLPKLVVANSPSHVRVMYVFEGDNTEDLQLVVEGETTGLTIPANQFNFKIGDDGSGCGGMPYFGERFPKAVYNPSGSTVDLTLTIVRTN